MAAPARTYTVTEFEASPGSAMRHAREGETVEITSRGQSVLLLVSPTPAIRWGNGKKPVGLSPAIEILGDIQDIIADGRR